ncbi:MAG TPA: TetR/AcrR family transcriptional regulator [Candidatus Avanaerovorax faecigallinarum]|nr:TetR/AcrR family transcriptional regulator [Candidatus Avanaerovorax faecigallinarum]
MPTQKLCSASESEFITAFWQLYKKDSTEKIPVSRICRAAGYNRSTFYNHFRDIYDLRDRAVALLLAPVREQIFALTDVTELFSEDTARKIVMPYFLSQNDRIETVFKRRDEYVIGDQIKANFYDLLASRMPAGKQSSGVLEEISMLLEYQISAALGLIGQWYRDGCRFPGEAVMSRLFEISAKGVFNSMKERFDKLRD